MEYISNTDKERIKKEFLKEFGNFIKKKREYKNFSLEDVANFIGVSHSTLSRYESGTVDMGVSNIPLFSLCYDFSIKGCFSTLEMKELLKSFHGVTMIKRHAYQRKDNKIVRGYEDKILKAQVFEKDGVEYTEYVQRKYKDKTLSTREKLAKGIMKFDVVPFEDTEFAIYLSKEDKLLEMLEGAGKILDYIGESEKKETIKLQVADFVIDNIIVEKVLNNPTLSAKRAYMYYKKLLEINDNCSNELLR